MCALRMRIWVASIAFVLVAVGTARAQGVQTGTITGTVQSADGLSLPGVTVTAASPSLQGQRAATTDVNGVYFIKGLPAGTYTVSFVAFGTRNLIHSADERSGRSGSPNGPVELDLGVFLAEGL